MEAAQDIRERTFQYALRAIKVYQSISVCRNGAGTVLAKQYLRAATSVGANLEEAYAAESKRDFMHKCRIALKEVRESRYWLRLINESEILISDEVHILLAETRELVAILTTIVKKTSHSLNAEEERLKAKQGK